jgi:serine/threonine protein kinase
VSTIVTTLVIRKKRGIAHKHHINDAIIEPVTETSEKYATASNDATQFSRRSENSTGASYSERTVTIQGTLSSLAVPLYKKYEYGKDFVKENEINVGAFGTVYAGLVINENLRNERNNGIKECVIKISPKASFESNIQELSIHEVFRDNKYFAKLICYSEKPFSIVLKYYWLGSLEGFLFSKNFRINNERCTYSLKVALHLSIRTTYALKLMHSKFFIHNDIKPPNVLLDGDKDEPLFPVICDFGIVTILESAEIINGFKTQNIKASTLEYSAPEILKSYIQKCPERVSSFKTDVYSTGILLLELFSRKSGWKNFNVDFILSGGLPDLSLKRFLDNFEDIKREVAVELLRLLLECLEMYPEKRPSMIIIHDKLLKIQTMSQTQKTVEFEKLKV